MMIPRAQARLMSKRKTAASASTPKKNKMDLDKSMEVDPPVAPIAGGGGRSLEEVLSFENPKTADEFASLLNEFRFDIAGVAHRLTEIEFYYTAPNHDDPFTHGDPMQWYFHKSGKGYKGGSYKGMDLTFGQHGAFAGILIRGVAPLEGGSPVYGPSLVVDHILALNKAASIEVFADKSGFDLSASRPSQLCLVPAALPPLEHLQSGRVGLTLKKTDGERLHYIMKNYRFLTGASANPKGKQYVVSELFAQGLSPDAAIAKGFQRAMVLRAHEEFEAGQSKNEKYFFGKVLNGDDICRLRGFLHAHPQ